MAFIQQERLGISTEPVLRQRKQTCRLYRTRARPRWTLVSLLIALPFLLLGPQFGTLLVVTSFSTVRRQSTRLLATDMDTTAKDDASRWFQSVIDTTVTETVNSKGTTNELSRSIKTRFFLVNTKHPGNVGSSARSIKTMGFFPEGLVVVDPHDSRVLGRKKCIDASSGAKDVLEEALLVVEEETNGQETSAAISNDVERCLSKALREAFGEEDVLVCGTGMPVDMSHSRVSRVYLEPRKLFENLIENYQSNFQTKPTNSSLNIAFVFGNERFGMVSEDLDLCDVVLGIPTNPSFGSLNLATAVQIVAYDWRQALGGYK